MDVRRQHDMPFIDWSGTQMTQKVETGHLKTLLNLELNEVQWEQLVSCLTEVYNFGGREVRIFLGGGWTLFWKQRDTEGRALVSHPETGIWVGTIALEQEQGVRLISNMKTLEMKQSLELGKLISLATVSNLDLKLIRFS